MSRDFVTGWGEISFFSDQASRPSLRTTNMRVHGAISLVDKVGGT
jgi:hypothetical protein